MTNTCDTSFAHAVRLAATGIRSKAGVDVIAEAGPLREILCGEQTLDPQGLELLALAVTGKLRKIKQPSGEAKFAHAVRRASAAWRTGKYASPTIAGAMLADMLRSGEPALGLGERKELAELFAPQTPSSLQDTRMGRPPKGAGHAEVVAVVQMVQREVKQGAAQKYAVSITAEMFRLSIRTVEEYVAITKEREAALRTASMFNSP